MTRTKPSTLRSTSFKPLHQVHVLAPLSRHCHAAPTLPPHCFNAAAAPTLQQTALTPPAHSSLAAPCSLHAAPTPPPRRLSAAVLQRHPHYVFTQHCGSNAAAMPPQCPPYAAITQPSRRPRGPAPLYGGVRSSHAAPQQAERLLHHASTSLAHWSNAAETPPSRRPHATLTQPPPRCMQLSSSSHAALKPAERLPSFTLPAHRSHTMPPCAALAQLHACLTRRRPALTQLHAAAHCPHAPPRHDCSCDQLLTYWSGAVPLWWLK